MSEILETPVLVDKLVLDEARNPIYLEDGRIDCEVNHPVYGWIPFTAAATDSEEHGRVLFARLVAGDFGAIAPAQAQTSEQLHAVIAERRYQAETAGIVFNGMAINTERDSQALINGAVVSCLLDPAYVCNWKTPAGPLVLDADTLKAVGLAVRAHVQACFDREIALMAHVEAGTYTEAMLNQGWPSTGA